MASLQQDHITNCRPADLSAVAAIVNNAGTSFARGMRILPRRRRYGMYAVYAFCRAVDDIADGDAGVADPALALEVWRGRVAGLYEGRTDDALDRVLAAAIREFDLAQDDFNAVIDGMLMDLDSPIVAPDEATLDLYCDRVASAVGRLSVRVFGAPSKMGERVAHHLGRALQLTNILRDLQEDADRGRLYLPRELLHRFKVPDDPQKALYAPGLDGLARVLACRARDHFRLANDAADQSPRHAMRPARMMAASYLPVLQALERRGWTRPDIPVRVSKVVRMSRSVLAALR